MLTTETVHEIDQYLEEKELTCNDPSLRMAIGDARKQLPQHKTGSVIVALEHFIGDHRDIGKWLLALRD